MYINEYETRINNLILYHKPSFQYQILSHDVVVALKPLAQYYVFTFVLYWASGAAQTAAVYGSIARKSQAKPTDSTRLPVTLSVRPAKFHSVKTFC